MNDDTDRLLPPVQAVIFDMDGTLIATEAVMRAAMQAAADAAGHELPDALFADLVGVHRAGNTPVLRRHFGAAFDIERFYREADTHFEVLWREGAPLRPGAAALLDRLSARGVPMAIATSTASPEAEERLAEAGIAHHFRTVVTRDAVRCPKPHPEPYLTAAARLGVPPDRCAAVEDSPNGLRAAAAAGTVALLIPDLIPATAETVALAFRVFPDLDAAGLLIEQALALR